MGRGDQRSRQGKVRRGTFGKTRPKQSKRNRARRERAAAAGGGANRPPRGAGTTGGTGAMA